jgi:hypothetical protein
MKGKYESEIQGLFGCVVVLGELTPSLYIKR